MKPLLRGEPRHRCVQALFAGAQRASRVGGTRPPRLSTGGGNGKGGVQTSLLPQAVRVGVVRMSGTPLGNYVLAFLPCFSSFRSPIDVSIRSFRFPKSCWRHPLLCRASIRTLMGRTGARCMLGSDLKPRSITTVTDLGLLGAAIFTTISAKDQWRLRSHPNKAVDVFANKTSRGWPPRYQLMLAIVPSSGFLNAICWEWLRLGGVLALGLLCCFRCRRAVA